MNDTYTWNRKTKYRDIAIGSGMFICALFAVLGALKWGFSPGPFALFVFIVGSTPWIVYNAIAYVTGWEKSHVLDLLWYWLEIAISAP